MPSSADYMRQFRAENPDYRGTDKLRQRAYRRALLVLRRRHRAEFDDILNAERAELGLPPVGALKPGPRRPRKAA